MKTRSTATPTDAPHPAPDPRALPSDPRAAAPTEEADLWLPFQRLDAYRVAKELARLVHQAPITNAELRDQATRAANRTFLGLAEGLPIDGQAMRRKYFVEANASLHEALAAVDLAATIGAARAEDSLLIQRLGVRLKRMLRGLLH
jgi:four helix bundle protein